jgi:hypothetical protein
VGEIREVRINKNVVERPAKPWTQTLHALLHHLHGSGLPVPEPFDVGGGVERVTLVPGAAGSDAWAQQLSVESVRSAGRLLRRVHDATVGWVPPADANWAVPFLPGDVIGHGGRDALVPGSGCLLSGKRGLSACLIEPCAFEGLGLVQ